MKTLFSKTILFLCCTLMLTSCKVNQTRNNLKIGRWVYSDSVNGIKYKSTGKYKKGVEKKTWKYTANEKVTKIEKYKNEFCLVTNFHINGKIASTGKTKLITKDDLAHWFYDGEWKFYDINGNFTNRKFYDHGQLLFN